MRFVFNRAFVTLALFALGLLAFLNGEMEGAAWLYGGGFAYWFAVGIAKRLGLGRPSATQRRAPRRQRPSVPVTASSAVRHTQSDGLNGAFSRLHPNTQDWLMKELRARNDTQ